MTEKFIGCRVMRLPAEKIIEAAKTAVDLNPANKVELIGLPRELLDQMTPLHLALLTNKYWGAGGVKLSVGFLDNPDAATRSRILSHMNAWGQRCNVVFTEGGASSDVRITRTSGQGYYSYLGSDIRHIPVGQPTMNLEAFTASTSEREYRRVVRHETGHTLGFPHEHMRRELVDRINPERAKAYFLKYDGWDAQTVQEQVLTPLDDSTLTTLSGADQLSIMCYNLPAEITTDGQDIVGGLDINENDFALAIKCYPPLIGQPPEPPIDPSQPPIKPPVSPPPPPPPSPPPPVPTNILGRYNFQSINVRKGQVLRLVAPVAFGNCIVDLSKEGTALARVGGVPWAAILAAVQWARKNLGPLAIPYIQQLIAKMNLTPEQAAIINGIIQTIIVGVPTSSLTTIPIYPGEVE